MKFRRSVKSEKHDSGKPVMITIPQKDAIAIEPPKKVIKALYEWNGNEQAHIYLSFSAGDFLHVVGRENDTEWYEACNPLKNERGLVPVKYFENVGKTVRDSGGSASSASATHDSGYAEGTAGAARTAGEPPVPAPPAAGLPQQMFAASHRSSKSVSKSPAGVYGIVAYDFQAERPDELDAKEGEAIIVIAQSNPEWFVAKPITRLGGPGLIPVSFIELRDMTTGQPVADPLEAVQRAGIPRVEEWKKMAAEYKNTSIPLGTVTSSQQMQSLQQGMDRMSLGGAQNGNGHARSASAFQRTGLSPLRASVPRFVFADDKYHFVVECRLSDGSHWDLSRIYEDFYELQISLINAFPEESGQTGKQRVLPYMPGPVQFVTDNISEGRRANLDEYLRDLLALPQYIPTSALVRGFFAPRQGDYEVDPNAIDLDEHARPGLQSARYSQVSRHSQQQAPSHQYSASQASINGYGHQRQQQSMASAHARAPSETPGQGPSASTASLAAGPPLSTGPVKVKAWYDRDTCVVIRMPARGAFGFDQLYQKIAERRRLEYRGLDPRANNNDNNDDELEIEYRDELDEEYYTLEGDEDLDVALARNEKLTLAVRKADKKKQPLQMQQQAPPGDSPAAAAQ